METGELILCKFCALMRGLVSIVLMPLSSQTAIYAQGVGLGASKGKDIENLATVGYSGYQMAQETVRPYL